MNQTSSEKPEKLYYRIREVSRITGVKAHVLRYWESEFPALRPEKGPNDQRRYRPGDIELILRIKELLYKEKYTIAGARRRLQGRPDFEPAAVVCGEASGELARRPDLDRIACRLNRVKQDLAELQALLAS